MAASKQTGEMDRVRAETKASAVRCSLWPRGHDGSEGSRSNPHLGKPEGLRQHWVLLGGWHTLGGAQSQEQRSGVRGGSVPQPISTEQRVPQMLVHAHPIPLWPSGQENPHSEYHKRAEKTLQPKWSVLIVAKHTEGQEPRTNKAASALPAPPFILG